MVLLCLQEETYKNQLYSKDLSFQRHFNAVNVFHSTLLQESEPNWPIFLFIRVTLSLNFC